MRNSRRCRPAGNGGQAGQALAEALVACLVLVPMLLLIALLGKYQSVQLAAIDAARHLAFECTVRLHACDDLAGHPQLVDELRIGYFARTDREVQSNYVIDGDAPARKRLDESPMNAQKAVKRLLKWTIFFLMSLAGMGAWRHTHFFLLRSKEQCLVCRGQTRLATSKRGAARAPPTSVKAQFAYA